MKMMSASSTLVETVSINYEDFNEHFLTCSTCLCMYDEHDHTPKLLSCSHTVCRSCLERIAEGIGVRDAGSFRCPICRETIPMPRGGIVALPPSFLVNQLLDLMSRQRREIIPKCSVHMSQDLMFCETCDVVFCTICTGGAHENGNGGCDHTIVPFSTAIKRMSEILLYKAQQCIEKLGKAAENVTNEIGKLESNSEDTMRLIELAFLDVTAMIEKRKEELLEESKKITTEKKNILEEQLAIIESEKTKVELQCSGLQHQVEIRNISSKINDLNEKMDSFSVLLDPRENAFVSFEYKHNSSLDGVQKHVAVFGKTITSKTMPSLCFVNLEEASAHLLSSTTLQTVDYHGAWQEAGGDPVTTKLRHENGDEIPTEVVDNNDGTYEIQFTPAHPGAHLLHVCIFDRPIKRSPFSLNVSEHINPVARYGTRGCRDRQLTQPVGVATCSIQQEGLVLVSDTGNSRIVVMTAELELLKYIEGHGLEDRSATGLAVTPCDTLLVINWRSKKVSQINFDGELLSQFTHNLFEEPIDIAINSKGHVLVADNGAHAVFVLDINGKMLKVVRQRVVDGRSQQIMSICSGPQDDILIAGEKINIFNSSGEFLREILGVEKKGHFGGICYDGKGFLLATRSGKSKSYINVYNYSSGDLNFVIDSDSDKLKRPSGLAVMPDDYLYVVDLGNDCIKKFLYR